MANHQNDIGKNANASAHAKYFIENEHSFNFDNEKFYQMKLYEQKWYYRINTIFQSYLIRPV